jgi:hypothetical protein
MGLFDEITPVKGTRTTYTRAECKTYEQAYAYFQYNVKQWAKKVWSADGAEYEANISKLPIWSKERVSTGKKVQNKAGKTVDEKITQLLRTSDGGAFLEISLHSMPLYWEITPKTKTVNGREEKVVVEILKWVVDKETGVGSKVWQRNHEPYIGSDKAQVKSLTAGWELLVKLADEEDPAFTEILTRAAQAMDYRDKELFDVEEYAKVLYHEARDKAETASCDMSLTQVERDRAEAFVLMNDWDTKDERGSTSSSPDDFTVDSKGKTQKKNQYKATARGRLGHDRAKVVIHKSVEGI